MQEITLECNYRDKGYNMCNNCESENIVEQDLCQECLDNFPSCEDCSCKIINSDDVHEVGGNIYCDDCYDDLPCCEHCSETVLKESLNSHNVCEDCQDNYTNCIRCGCYVELEDTVEDIDDDHVCSVCQEDGCIPEDSDYWYHYDDLYYHSNEGCYYTYPPNDVSILGYHEGEKTKIRGSVSGNYVGFELEIIPHVERYGLAEQVNNLDNFCCEEDGSLDDDGFEIISNYGDLDKVLELAEELCDLLKGKAVSHDTDCCGLHVHLTKNDNYSTAKMICFWNDPVNHDFITHFARRDSVSYARKDDDKCIKNFEDNNYDWYCDFDEKYNIVNVTYQTLEVRAFKGTIKKERLLACIELSYYTHEYAKQCSKAADLTWQKFMEWLPESKWIKPYLVSRNFNFEGNTVCA